MSTANLSRRSALGAMLASATAPFVWRHTAGAAPSETLLHATMLHLLGLDHKRLTYRFGGRDMRLTDVHGELVTGILA